jgi:hypothetical protein
MALAALVLCKTLFVIRLYGLIKRGAPKDLAKASGSVSKGVTYSFMQAMMPHNKESAYLHLPTYGAGIIYHAGTLLSLMAFVWFFVSTFFVWPTPKIVALICCVALAGAACCGIALFCKRIIKRELRALSCADDYISNGLTTLFQLLTACYFVCNHPLPYYIVTTLFFLWLPIGKTRHLLYFFAARFHLGFFYGRRNVWPQ